MDKKESLRLIYCVIGILIIFPIVINYLMYLKLLPVKGEINTWISTLGTFWGAIIGGVISGILTLVGVRKSVDASFKGIETTIMHQEKERYKETIGPKLNKLYTVKRVIYKLDRMLQCRKFGWNENHEPEDPQQIDNAIYNFILPLHNQLLEDASSVDWEFFNEIDCFVKTSRKLTLHLITEDLDELAIVVDKLTETIENVHEARLKEKFKESSI
ncbi:hypothetical protein V1498_06770 [Peribacillus sp. SCS-26]|uniref:hypothetical protein n=1 Tax=Paraperibacillus marinus TaxID=3115295 RepID=UPI003906999C